MAGLWTPSNPNGNNDKLTLDAMSALARGRTGQSDDSADKREMRLNRRAAMSKNGALSGGGTAGANISFATGRPKDPMFYWEQNNLPYDIRKPGEMKKIRAYCNTPDAPVWMGDFSFKSIGEIQVGDEVIGWDRSTYKQKTGLVRTTVLAINRRIAPEVVEITMESGRTIRCTPDHEWANPWYSPKSPKGWSRDEYLPAAIGRDLKFVVDPTTPLTSEKELRAAAWLAGIYDGEGCGTKISQSPSHNPRVYEAICDNLDVLGLRYTRDPDGIRLAGDLHNRRNRYEVLRFLNQTEPIRRTSTAIDKLFLKSDYGQRDRVVSIRSLGPGEVVSMQTGTGNYTAWGYASRNCRLLYMTHPIIASCVDIYSKYPLTGMALQCKDEALTEFYTTLFFDQLNYEEYLIDVGREYWTCGEAWPLGQFNETLGVWEDDELINPDDVEVIKTPFQKEPRFEMRLPETLRELIEKREPAWEYEALMRNYPELAQFVAPDARMPVSNVLLKQLRFKADTFHPRGIPILMRGFRAVMQEEMLNAAQDAIADRLYTPLILARLGASATDLGTSVPWIPTEDDLTDFEEALDAALAADFRVLTHHFALQMDSVFGREAMPNFSPDFDRLVDRQLQVFGLSRTMLNGASGGETYAADALNRDLVSQLLTTYQRMIKKLYRDRALVVAEAQEHYDYEERGGKKYPIMEEVLEVDEESGEERIVEKPKLLVPDLTIKAMSFSDEATQRQLVEALKESGVPISMETRLTNIPIDLDEEIEKSKDENVKLAIASEETRKATFLALRSAGLPIPDDLAEDFTPMASDAPSQQDQGLPPVPLPSIGMDPANALGLTAGPEDYAAAEAEGEDPDAGEAAAAAQQAAMGGGTVIPMPTNKQRPPESDEQRANMPKASKFTDPDGNVVVEGNRRLLSGPSHLGRRASLNPRLPFDEQEEAEG